MATNDNWDSFDDLDAELDENIGQDNSNWDSFDDLEFEDVKLNIPEQAPAKENPIQVTPISSKKFNDEYDDLGEGDYEGEFEEYDYEDGLENYEDYDEYDDYGEPKGPSRRGGNNGGKNGKKKIVPVLIAIFSAIALIALIVLLSSLIFKSCKDDGDVGSNTTVAWEENKNQTINDLINKYYDARVLADINTLKTLVDESITINEDSVKNESAMTEAYREIKCYVTKGLNDGEYAVYVTYAVKFKNIDTPAPGLIPFYVKTDSSGNMRLIPWQYIESGENFTEIRNYIDSVSRCDQITQLSDSIEENYQKALNSDTKLKEYIMSIGGNTGETEATTQAEGESTTAAGGEEGGFTACDEKWYAINDGVNIRKEPSTDSDILQTVDRGQELHVVGKNNEWLKLQLRSGDTAYISMTVVSQTQP